MEKDPKKLGNEPREEGGDLQGELQFFLENRLDRLLEEAEKFRNIRSSWRGDRSRGRKREDGPDRNQGFLPFLHPVHPNREGNTAEPESKASGDEL